MSYYFAPYLDGGSDGRRSIVQSTVHVVRTCIRCLTLFHMPGCWPWTDFPALGSCCAYEAYQKLVCRSVQYGFLASVPDVRLKCDGLFQERALYGRENRYLVRYLRRTFSCANLNNPLSSPSTRISVGFPRLAKKMRARWHATADRSSVVSGLGRPSSCLALSV